MGRPVDMSSARDVLNTVPAQRPRATTGLYRSYPNTYRMDRTKGYSAT